MTSLALAIALGLFLADQLAKLWIRNRMSIGDAFPVIPGFFQITYLRNTGAAWGLFSGNNWMLTLLSMVVLVMLWIGRKHFMAPGLGYAAALGCLTGGILGNLADRIRLGWVTDFLDFFVGAHHWPAFNIADAAICTGVGLYMLSSVRSSSKARKTADSAPEEPSA